MLLIINITAFQITLILALVIAVIAITITRSTLFERLRNRLKTKNEWLGKLFSCHYCLSHWLSIIIVLIYQPRVINSPLVYIDIICSIFIVIGLAMPMAWIIFRSYKYLEPDTPMEVLLREALIEAKKEIIKLSSIE